MVTSISGNNVTWRDSKTGNLITDVHQDLEKVMKKGGRTRRKKQSGGYLTGPSHEQGGIPANITGHDPIELEGGEYIINAQTVDALGVPFLDQINSTATTYHQGGFQQGQLPSPSNYRRGGKVRKKQYGGTVDNEYEIEDSDTYNDSVQCIRHRMPDGTIMEGPTHGAGQTCIEWSTGRNNMRRGGRPSRKKRGGRPSARRPMRRGGSARRPARAMRRGGSARRPVRGRGRNIRRMQQGGHICPPGTSLAVDGSCISG